MKIKYAFSYNLSRNNMRAQVLRPLLLQYINSLTEIGFKIVATVCDQCSSNGNVYICLGVDKYKPYFEDLDGNKVYAFFDTPHLIKSLRNSFIKTEMINRKGEIINSSKVKKIVAEDERFSTKILPKEGNVHISPNTFQKMSVKLVFQLFRHSTYAVINAVKNYEFF